MAYKAPPEFAERFPGRPYDAEIAYADHEIGRLLDRLRAGGRMERTLVVATSDHGESLGEHGESTHSTSLYDAVLAVPLVMRGPDLPAGRVVPGVVRVIDVAPTVLAHAGLDPLPDAGGRDLASLWQAEAGSERVAYSETLATMLDNGWAPLHSIRTNDWLYVRAPRPELYDVEADPGQVVNLVETDPERAAPHRGRLDALVEEALADEKMSDTLEVDDTTREQLQALGYAIPEGEVIQTGIDPKDGRRYLPLLHRAMGAYEAGDLALAERLFLETSRKLPGSARAHSQLAAIYHQAGRYKRALRHIELAISFDPRTSLHRALRGEILLVMGDAEAAREAYREAAELDADAPWSRIGFMWEALDEGNMKRAARYAREILDDDPTNTGVSLKMASLWAQHGEYERAVSVLEEAVRYSLDSRFTRMRLAIEYARTGRTEQALAARELAGSYATNAKLGTALGRAFAAAGDFGRAEQQLRAVLAENPDDAFALESLERVHAWQQKLAGSDES